MIITCPDCGKRYKADEKAFAPSGRKVKCANCGFVWFQEAAPAPDDDHAIEPVGGYDDDDPIHDQDNSYDDGYDDDGPQPPVPHTVKSVFPAARVAGWALLALIVSGVAASAYQYRHFVVKAWPQTVSAYNLLGLDTSVTGVAFRDISTERNMQDGMPVLLVRGRVVNMTNRAVPVPKVRLSLVDEKGEEVYWWFHSLPLGRLDAEEDYRFVTSLPITRNDATHLKVEFEQNEDVVSGL